jgi:hypothetical protein
MGSKDASVRELRTARRWTWGAPDTIAGGQQAKARRGR